MSKYSYKCINCKDEFKTEKKLEKSENQYCPYCYAVHKGEPDDQWLPKITKREMDKNRFREIKNLNLGEENPEGNIMKKIKSNFPKKLG